MVSCAVTRRRGARIALVSICLSTPRMKSEGCIPILTVLCESMAPSPYLTFSRSCSNNSRPPLHRGPGEQRAEAAVQVKIDDI